MDQRDLVGQLIDNQIEILEPIGEGGMGAVYRALHRGWNQPMAVKVPHSFLLAEQADRERFLLEAHTWIDLGIHPHIVTCWFIHPWEGIPLLFIDLLTGGNLKDEITQGRLRSGDWGRILALAIQACDGLAHAHDLGLIHRDIKPANLLLDDSGRLCVTDFGLVKNLSQGLAPAVASPSGGRPVAIQDLNLSLTATGAVVGTPRYASPEQWMQDDHLTARADLYSLGVVLYEMAIGKVPFDAPSGPSAIASLFIAHTSHKPPDPALVVPDIPAGLRDMILSCLAKEPENRPASAREMRNTLSEVYRKTTGEPYPEVPQAAQPRADSLNNKAVSLWNLGKQNQAVAAWDEALVFDALHPESVFNRAMVRWSDGKLEPEEVIRRLQIVKATHSRAAAYLGLFYLTRGQTFEAEIELKKALQLEEIARDARFWKALGDCQMAGERLGEARDSFGRSLELSNRQADVQSRLKIAEQAWLPPHPALPPSLVDKGASRHDYFPRSRPVWETLADAPPRQVYLTQERVLALQASRVTAYRVEDGSPQWTCKHLETPLLQVAEELGLWTGASFPNQPFHSLKDGSLQFSLTEGDKFYAFHPGSRRLVIGNIDLWIAELTQDPGGAYHVKRMVKLAGHDKQVAAAAFSPNGDKVVTGGYDRQLMIWSARTGQPLHRVQRHKDFIESVAVSASGEFVATGSRDRSVRLTALQTGLSYLELKDHPATVLGLQFTPDGQKLLAWCGPSAIQHTVLWDLADRSRKSFDGHCRLTQDGLYLMAPRHLSGLYTLEICRLETQAWIRCFPAGSAVVSASDSKDGLRLCFSTTQGNIGLWEFSESTRLVPSGLHLTRTRSYRDLDTSRRSFQTHLDSARGAVERKDYRVAWVELEKARSLLGYYSDPEALKVAAHLVQVLRRETLRSFRERREVKDPSEQPIGPTQWVEDGSLVLSSAGKWLRLWDANTGSVNRGMVGHGETVTALDCAGNRALSATTGKDLRLWNLQSGECEQRYAAPTLGVSWVQLHPTQNRAVILTTNQEMLWLDLGTGKFFNSIRVAGVQCVSASEDWSYCLAGGNPGSPCLTAWNLNQPKKIADEKKFLARVGGSTAALQITAACVLPGGVFALAASQDQRIRLWDLLDLRCLQEYQVDPEAGPVSSLAWSQDGHHFVSGHSNGALRAWALAQTDRPIKSVDGHWGKVVAAQLTRDARFLLTVQGDKTLRFWELDWGLNSDGPARPLRSLYSRPGFLARLFGRK